MMRLPKKRYEEMIRVFGGDEIDERSSEVSS